MTVDYDACLLGKDADKLFEPIQPPQGVNLSEKGEKLVDDRVEKPSSENEPVLKRRKLTRIASARHTL